LQLFLSRKLIIGQGQAAKEPGIFQNAIVVGNMRRDAVERYIEESSKLIEEDIDLESMREVACKGEKQYLRTRNAASAESVKRAKHIAQSEDSTATNMLFEADESADLEQRRLAMLARVSGFRPTETVFEIGKRGEKSEAAEMMKHRRAKVAPKNQQKAANPDQGEDEDEGRSAASRPGAAPDADSEDEELILTQPNGVDMDLASDSELELTFTVPEEVTRGRKKSKDGLVRDSEFFMGYTPSTINLAEDRGYGVHSGGTNASNHFLDQARGATMDLNNDEASGFNEANKSKGLRWDKKSKKYVQRANDEDGSKGVKMIRGESGQKIAASFKSGRYDAWKRANRVERLPRVGEQERPNAHFAAPQDGAGGKRFKHKQERAPKEADKYRDDYHVRKKRVQEAKEKRIGKFAEGKGKNELRGAEDVRKLRKLQERRKDKNARPMRKKKF
jgi:ATP-dependent RNA helicase DDX54/DBP10